MGMPIRGVYADESVKACMGVCSGRVKYIAADGPAEGTAPTQAVLTFPLRFLHRTATLAFISVLCLHVPFHGGHASHREPVRMAG